jgi:hypothetical protein
MFAGYASGIDENAPLRYGFGPCLFVPDLARARNATRYYTKQLNESVKQALVAEIAPIKPKRGKQGV